MEAKEYEARVNDLKRKEPKADGPRIRFPSLRCVVFFHLSATFQNFYLNAIQPIFNHLSQLLYQRHATHFNPKTQQHE